MLRMAEGKDFTKIAEMYVKLHNIHKDDYIKEIDINGAKRILLEDFLSKKVRFYVLEKEDEMVGYFAIQIKYYENTDGQKERRVLWLMNLYVKEEYRGLGYGKEMMDMIKAIAKSEECQSLETNLWVVNSKAEQFYKRSGMVEIKKILRFNI